MDIKKISKYLLIAGIFFVPAFVSAQPGIVPEGCRASSCSVCQFVTLIDRLIQFALFYLILPVCVIAFITAGVLLLSSAGSPQKIERGKSIFFYALWGLILAFAAFLVIHIILVTLVDSDYLNFNNGISFPECP